MPGHPERTPGVETTTGPWDRLRGASVGTDRFGASAPGETELEELGITPENVANTTLGLLQRAEQVEEALVRTR